MLRTSNRLPHPSARKAVAPLAGIVLAALVLAGCSGGEDPAPTSAAQESTRDDGVTVLQPGRPGEPVETVGPEDVPAGSDWNHSDVAFVQMMVPHHAQALTMSSLAPTRASSPAVKALARRIKGSQGPEVMTLSAWLQARDLEVPKAGEDPSHYDHGEHGHTPMMGMLTDAEMARLKKARGSRFDRLFLRGMISHHQGAVDMAKVVATDGTDLQVSEIAADVATGQAAEITRMRALLHRL